jgi:Asp/Glu/hydantoin racemase
LAPGASRKPRHALDLAEGAQEIRDRRRILGEARNYPAVLALMQGEAAEVVAQEWPALLGLECCSLAAEGAESIVLGCTGLASHAAAAEDAAGIPVIEPCQAAGLAALLAVAGNRPALQEVA